MEGPHLELLQAKPVSHQNDLCIRPVIIHNSEVKKRGHIFCYTIGIASHQNAPHVRNTLSSQLAKFLALSLLSRESKLKLGTCQNSMEFYRYRDINIRKPKKKKKIPKQGVSETLNSSINARERNKIKTITENRTSSRPICPIQLRIAELECQSHQDIAKYL